MYQVRHEISVRGRFFRLETRLHHLRAEAEHTVDSTACGQVPYQVHKPRGLSNTTHKVRNYLQQMIVELPIDDNSSHLASHDEVVGIAVFHQFQFVGTSEHHVAL